MRREAGEVYADRTWEELLNLCTRLKDPALLTEEHARQYRDHQLDTVSPNTTKTRIRSIRALFEVALAEEWISKNSFNAVKLRFIKGQAKLKEVVRLDHIDKKVRSFAML